VTSCANPGCDNALPARGRTGRPAIYCSPACRKRQRATPITPGDATNTTDGADTVVVELDHPDTSPDGRPPERIWTLRLRRGEHVVVIAEGLGWPTANALARQLQDLFAPPPQPSSNHRPGPANQIRYVTIL
jgi:hypothetical protein